MIAKQIIVVKDRLLTNYANKEAFENVVLEGRNVTAPSTILLFIRRVAKQQTKQI